MNLKDALEKAMVDNPEAGKRILGMFVEAEAKQHSQEAAPPPLELPVHPAPEDDLVRDAERMERRNRIYRPGIREGYYLIDCVRFADAFYAETQKPDRLVTSHPHIEVERLLAGWATWEIPTIDVNLLYEYGWHTVQVIREIGGPRSGRHEVATITGPMFNDEVVLLKPGVYPQDYPTDIHPDDIERPVTSLSDVLLAARDHYHMPDFGGASHRMPRPAGYAEITIDRRRYYFHSSKTGVEALFGLTGVRLLVNRLMVWPGQAGDWIGNQGFNAKRLAKLLGLRHLKVVEIAAADQ